MKLTTGSALVAAASLAVTMAVSSPASAASAPSPSAKVLPQGAQVSAQDKATLDKLIAKLITELDHDKFAVREAATRALEKLGLLAAPALARVVQEAPSPEAFRRASELLAKARNAPPLLRTQRGVEVLVRLATADARQLLEQLAKGPPAAWLTQEAKAGVQRLGK